MRCTFPKFNKLPSASEARSICNAEKIEFDGEPYQSECCGRLIGANNAMHEITSTNENGTEVEGHCCTYCLKRDAYYQIHQHDEEWPCKESDD